MAFLVQTNQGDVPEANAYVTVAEFRDHCATRGYDLTGRTDADCEVAIVRATDFLDARFEFVGRKTNRPQATAWPREMAYDVDGRQENGIPSIVKKVCCEYGFKALTIPLMPDPTRDASGAIIAEKSEEVGPIKTSVKYASPGAYDLPKYPLIDRMLARTGLVLTGRTLVRA